MKGQSQVEGSYPSDALSYPSPTSSTSKDCIYLAPECVTVDQQSVQPKAGYSAWETFLTVLHGGS